MLYLKRINSLPLINHISYKYAQVSDIGPSWSSCLWCAVRKKIAELGKNYTFFGLGMGLKFGPAAKGENPLLIWTSRVQTDTTYVDT